MENKYDENLSSAREQILRDKEERRKKAKEENKKKQEVNEHWLVVIVRTILAPVVFLLCLTVVGSLGRHVSHWLEENVGFLFQVAPGFVINGTIVGLSTFAGMLTAPRKCKGLVCVILLLLVLAITILICINIWYRADGLLWIVKMISEVVPFLVGGFFGSLGGLMEADEK